MNTNIYSASYGRMDNLLVVLLLLMAIGVLLYMLLTREAQKEVVYVSQPATETAVIAWPWYGGGWFSGDYGSYTRPSYRWPWKPHAPPPPPPSPPKPVPGPGPMPLPRPPIGGGGPRPPMDGGGPRPPMGGDGPRLPAGGVGVRH